VTVVAGGVHEQVGRLGMPRLSRAGFASAAGRTAPRQLDRVQGRGRRAQTRVREALAFIEQTPAIHAELVRGSWCRAR